MRALRIMVKRIAFMLWTGIGAGTGALVMSTLGGYWTALGGAIGAFLFVMVWFGGW